VRILSGHGRVWPDGTIKHAADARNLPHPPPAEYRDAGDGVAMRTGLEYWLQLQLIDRVTRVAAGLIFSPFIVLLILIVAQNRIFDDWHWDVSSILIALFCVGTTVACAILLQRAAKRAKQKALDELDKLLLRRIGGPRDDVGEKLARIRTDIASLNSGAFAG